MGKCLKCTAYKLMQFGRRAYTKIKASVSDEEILEGKYKKKVKIIYSKEK